MSTSAVDTPPPPPSGTSGKAVRTFALVGNPNAGKTSVFNALTGLRQKTGNYPGVTVEKKEGTAYTQHGKPVRILDLPGAYSLTARSPDEAIARDVLLGRRPDLPRPDGIVCVVDASNLERNLYLVTQVLELGLPTIVVLNMIDVAERRGLRIEAKKIEAALGCTVVTANATRKDSLIALKLALSRESLPVANWTARDPEMFEEARMAVQAVCAGEKSQLPGRARAEAFLLLTAEPDTRFEHLPPKAAEVAARWRERLDREAPGWKGELVQRRYAVIGDIVAEAVHRGPPKGADWTARLDRIFLHPVAGWAVFVGLMLTLFYAVFEWAAVPMDWIDGSVAALGEAVHGALPEGPVRSLLVDGVIAGVGGVVIFLPQILILFFFIALLESTGYLARGAFLLDRFMSRVGLHGKSFIPLLSSYACAIPGIMATRTIESAKDRLVTILVAPFMSCSARLPVYLLLIAVLLPDEQFGAWQKSLLLFGLYALGTVTAFVFAWFFRKTLLKGGQQHMLLELPPYKPPRWDYILREMFDRALVFLRRAGTIILGLSIVLWFLFTYPNPDAPTATEQLETSFAGQAGKVIEPVVEPLGYDWKIGLGVLASFAAREVFVSTMAVIYNVEDEEATADLRDRLRSQSWPDGRTVYTPLTVLSLLVFYVYALQCLSTVAITRRETGSWGWTLFQLGYMTGFAYLAALVVYQGGRALGFS